MPVTTHIDRARTRVETEREDVDAKIGALGRFLDRVADLPTESTPSASTGITATAGTPRRVDASTDDRCRAVRTAFAETVRPHSVADVDGSESLLETIRREFTDAIAVALAPTTEAGFTTDLKEMVVAEARTRRAEASALHRALGRERAQLDDAGAVVDDIVAWIAAADETPLSELGFEALRERHDALGRHRECCDELACQRQEFLRRTTNESVEVGVSHRSLVPYLYQDFPVDHPVLATVARLDDACAECQRAVRGHLVRRA